MRFMSSSKAEKTTAVSTGIRRLWWNYKGKKGCLSLKGGWRGSVKKLAKNFIPVKDEMDIRMRI